MDIVYLDAYIRYLETRIDEKAKSELARLKDVAATVEKYDINKVNLGISESLYADFLKTQKLN
ncbi:hypothetical protein [Chryseobacterium sp. 8AT]|uniref:hypothetical protein n=1 Tax=Chryseobacterium sp. 8AT TaxID=2653134 RepID=UPI0012EF50EC|nr:hypothetical protein [Chryseobacterium sp. 8AT]VXB03973.1 hypothetical protein CHRYSEO8AT_10277 [Chryseobacterium sp. 8AT]